MAKRTLRLHRDWTDEQVANYCGIPLVLIGDVIRPARQEVEQDNG
jgi:hypothetical protein